MSVGQLSLCGVAEKRGAYFVARRLPGGSQGGKWEFPGGKAEPGEDAKTALRREFEEELELTIQVGEVLFTGSFENRGRVYTLEAYRVQWANQEPVLHEHSEARWVRLADLLSLDLSDSDRLVAQALK